MFLHTPASFIKKSPLPYSNNNNKVMTTKMMIKKMTILPLHHYFIFSLVFCVCRLLSLFFLSCAPPIPLQWCYLRKLLRSKTHLIVYHHRHCHHLHYTSTISSQPQNTFTSSNKRNKQNQTRKIASSSSWIVWTTTKNNTNKQQW
jgi:hypothetical protein